MTKLEINSKETFHKVLDEMMEKLSEKPYEVGICSSYRKYDDDLYWFGEYKEVRVLFYPEWFAEGKIIMNALDKK